MPKTSDPKANSRLSQQLRANLARRKTQVQEREADPEASSLSYREKPVHDPVLRKSGKPETP